MSEVKNSLNEEKTKRIAILTSGGDAPGMNSVISAVYKAIEGINFKNAKHKEELKKMNIVANNPTDWEKTCKWELFLIKDGYKGLLKKDITPINDEWKHLVLNNNRHGGTIIGSSRCEEFKNESARLEAKAILESYNIDVLIAVGGDGTFKGLLKLCDLGIQCIGIPGTIDNDVRVTEDTIGFDTALNTVVNCIDKIRDTSNSHHRVTIVEVMGNKCGDLAIYAGPSADVISTSEFKIEEVDLISTIAQLRARLSQRSIIVLVTEKLYDVYKLAKDVETQLGIETRAVVLGSVQRGGSPSAYDRYLATAMGRVAIEQIRKSKTSYIITLSEHKIQAMPIHDASSFEEKSRKNDSVYLENQRKKVINLLALSGIFYKKD